ncbi:MAG TPA: NAD(P)H-dependent oxidoreductase subunit E [Chloroflexota bacterium]|nr:NAD(P)H-dependent oxidoreductase subunit E [Chloroflexota bacterium]
MLSEETRQKILALKTRYPERRSALGPSLYLLQAEQGYCSEDGMVEVAELLELVPADVLSVASFYTMFFKEPVGKKVVDICTNLACMVNGADDLLEYVSERLQTPVGGTSADGRCTLHHVECLGYCERAPVMQIDYRPFGPLTKETVDMILHQEKLLPENAALEDGQTAANLDLSSTRHFPPPASAAGQPDSTSGPQTRTAGKAGGASGA